MFCFPGEENLTVEDGSRTFFVGLLAAMGLRNRWMGYDLEQRVISTVAMDCKLSHCFNRELFSGISIQVCLLTI